VIIARSLGCRRFRDPPELAEAMRILASVAIAEKVTVVEQGTGASAADAANVAAGAAAPSPS
jgi:hypothetical protein